MANPDLPTINAVRHQLLHLHKQLIDAERALHERTHGRIAPADFMRMLIEDPALAWLQPMTALIVRIDEWIDDDERSHEIAAAWLDEVARLLAPEPALHDFHEHYAARLQDDPDIVMAHGAVMRAIKGPGS